MVEQSDACRWTKGAGAAEDHLLVLAPAAMAETALTQLSRVVVAVEAAVAVPMSEGMIVTLEEEVEEPPRATRWWSAMAQPLA